MCCIFDVTGFTLKAYCGNYLDDLCSTYRLVGRISLKNGAGDNIHYILFGVCLLFAHGVILSKFLKCLL